MATSQGSTKVHVLLTGSPGVGKTTLVKNVCSVLKKEGISYSGFYTEEVRRDHSRIGFDVVTLDGGSGGGKKAAALARVNGGSGPRVGQYVVDVKSFEEAALPTLSPPKSRHAAPSVVVVDEIGKMELFSRPFQNAVDAIFKRVDCVVLATVPVARGKPIPFVQKIVERPDAMLIHVDRHNRDKLVGEVLQSLKSSLQCIN